MFNLQIIDSEITNRCNAACPLCPRTGLDGKVSKIVKSIQDDGHFDLPVNVWDNILSSPYGFNIKRITYCGNFGDPMMHPQALEIFQTVAEYGVESQKADTNGSMKTPKWWSELGRIPGYEVYFSLDGLADTNKIYRVKTKYENIIANAEAFIAAGGKATWVFIVFKHNEHQVEEARALAKQLGFKNFIVKKSSRAYSPNKLEETQSYNFNLSKKKRVSADISLPSKSEYRPPADVQGVKHFPVNCMAMRRKQFYLTPDMKVMPCCHVHGSISRMEHFGNFKQPEFYNFLVDNKIKYDLKQHSFEEIVDSYRSNVNILHKLWDHRQIPICNRKCGSNLMNQSESLSL